VSPVDEVVAFLRDYVGLPGVQADTRLGVDVPFDSFAVVDVIAFIAGRYGKQLDPLLLSMDDFATPRTIAALIERS